MTAANNTFKLSKRLLSTTSASTFQKTAQPFTWDLGKYDESQIAQMQDMMTRVDEQDNIVGPISKLQGHLL